MPVVTDYTALLSGVSWAGLELAGRPMFITYSFLNAAPASHADAGAMGGAVSTFQAFDGADKQVARDAINEWAAACGLIALEVPTTRGDITFSWYDFTGTAWDGSGGIGFHPGGSWDGESQPYFTDHRASSDLGGDIMINLDYAVGGQPGYGLMLHEIGHALGLKHPFETFGTHDETLDPALDNTANTVMSYTGASPTTLGQLDKDAAAYLYGAAGSDGSQVQSWSWDSVNFILTQTGTNTLGDTIIGISVSDSILGQGGSDSIFGEDGNDTLNGGAGDDRIFAGAGNDTVIGGTGNDSIAAGGGIDTVNAQDGDDSVRGGDGNDRLNGLDGDDLLIGEADIDRLDGGLGGDTLWGGEGNDKLFGQDGADYMIGEDGKDNLDGGADNDTLFGDAGVDIMAGGEGDDYVAGGDDNDRIDGGAGNDLLWGDAGNDKLAGGDDADQLAGGDGRDSLSGGAGTDNIFGDAGADTLIGGTGGDSLTGGADLDRFQFDTGFGADIVWDFQDGLDKLAFAGIAGVTSSAAVTVANDGFGNTIITVGAEGTVLLINIAAAQITAADMLFL